MSNRPGSGLPYIELGARSAFSFLDGASDPEVLAARAAELGYPALALVDRDGLYGAPRFFKECRRLGLRALVGADLPLPEAGRARLYVESREGYRNLCRLITAAKAGRAKGSCQTSWNLLEEHARGLVVATSHLPALDRLQAVLSPRSLYVEIGRHLDRAEEHMTRRAVEESRRRGLPLLGTNDVRYASADGVDLADLLTCIREGTTLAKAGRLLSANAERHLKAPAEMARLLADLPGAAQNSAELAARLAFTLEDLGYRFPVYPVPEGESEFSLLEHLVHEGARRRYRPVTPKVAAQLARELQLIARLELAGYFLIVWDLVELCRRRGILVQGRGSAANSAVCYSLGITAVDPVGMGLLFERFLSEERGEWPDIDLDLPSGADREEVIQYVYQRYGPTGAAMTANCITYRSRSAVREAGKVLGFPQTVIDRLSRQLSPFEFRGPASEEGLEAQLEGCGLRPEDPDVTRLLRMTQALRGLPRHLGQHSGGMVLCHGRLDEIVPLEPASMPGRVVVQWDKEDCADLGLIKVDLLGLGMMAVLKEAVPLIRSSEGVEIDLAHLPQDDPAVYRMLERADTVGVFQVESRAQMATLPRMRPERFYDLVVEVAIIRPGPIVGQMVHPYLARRRGREPVRYPHPSLQPILERTLGVPLFQEQLMRIAMVAAGFTGGQAEELRRAMGFKRSNERMQALEGALRTGMTERGITADAQDEIVQSIRSFALYGFPESHAASFALIAYASAYLKAHHPAAFYAALLNNWPMGFYPPSTLIFDAKRHGVAVRPIDVTRSEWRCTLERPGPEEALELRVGLRYVAGLRREIGVAIARERAARPFSSIADLFRRAGTNQRELGTLASIGALNPLASSTRRDAQWQAAAIGREGDGLFAAVAEPAGDGPLRDMTLSERLAADFRGMGLSPGPHPFSLHRHDLTQRGVLCASELAQHRPGERVRVGGAVLVRQRPGTAKGFFFLTLEDETGFSNGIVTPQVFAEHRALLSRASALVIEGVLQNQDGVVSVKADRFETLTPRSP